MQMKKNYLLLFLMALLFGTANMRGKSLPWSQFIGNSDGYTVKIGNGFLSITKTEVTCVSDQSDLPKLSVSQQDFPKVIISNSDLDNVALNYKVSKKSFSPKGFGTQFEYTEEGNVYYLKYRSQYVTYKGKSLTLETHPSPDAVVEITQRAVGGGRDLTVVGSQYHNALALFQFHHSEAGGKITRTEGPFIGTGLGQYSKNFDDYGTNWKTATDNQFKNGNTPSYTADLVRAREEAIKGLHIYIPTSGYVYVTTKSTFEDQVRANSKIPGYSNTPIENIPGLSTSQPEKYLKATPTGYELTTNKSEAAVFYFDGHHLTGLDYGFGLGTANYTQTEDNQKTVIGQGLLKKTLDAGSYSVKVGDKFVKLDNTDGLSLTSNESDSHLFLEEATKFTLHTNDLGYVSFFAPTAVQVPAGVKIFSGTLNTSGTQVVFTEVSGNQIPANTAVLLQKGTSKATFEVEKIATASPIANNSLKGYAVSSSDHKNNAYGMMVENGNLVFKRLSDAVRAFRAVVYKNAAGSTQEFIPTSFAPTGIEGATIEENKEEIFDLTGRRVESPVKGQVYVKGGKKFIQK